MSTSTFIVEVLLYVHRNHRFIKDGSPGCPPQLSLLKCCFMSTETIGLLRTEPRTSTSTFIVEVALCPQKP